MVKTRFSDPYIPAGTVFGRLTVLEDVPRCGGRALCRCACGNEKKDVNSQGLKNGSIRSCGCLSHERRSKLNGFSKHPLYGVWNGIIDRCTDPRNPSYGNYGGRGITVCERWRDPWLFVADIEHEIGPRPEGRYKNGRALYSLDRKDNDGNYEPGNVQWSTTSQQVINQRKVSKMTLELDTMARKLDAVSRERDALAAELQALKASLAEAGGPPSSPGPARRA